MTRSLFSACSFPVLARIPLLPAADCREAVPGEDALLAEGMFLASRQVDVEVDLHGRDHGRMAVTRRGYEIRTQLRPVPHMVFAGVALARFTGQGETLCLRLGAGHRARTSPSAAWLVAVQDQILTEQAALSALTLTTSNVVTRRGPWLEHERPACSDARPQRVSVRATQATTLIVSLCTAGASASEIQAKVAERWKVPEPVVRTMLTELARDGFLQTDLLPGDVTVDPLGYLVGKLTPGHRLQAPLARLRGLLADADRYLPGYVPLLDVTDPAVGLGIDPASPDFDPADLPDRRAQGARLAAWPRHRERRRRGCTR